MKSATVALVFMALACGPIVGAEPSLKTEHFDSDPGWEGVNNRRGLERTIKQDFGYSATSHTGGKGEVGGFVTPASEAAYYAKAIAKRTLGEPITAKGKVVIGRGAGNTLLGYFNSGTINEWRTPNSLGLRLNGRGTHFYAYIEYCTQGWRAGGHLFDTVGPDGKKRVHREFPIDVAHEWSLTYDPKGNGGNGEITAIIGDQTMVAKLEPGHQAEGATFDRFGLLNVMKSADGPGELWLNQVSINDVQESFNDDPKWEALHNRREYKTKNIIRNFDFGFSPTHFADGEAAGEMGGLTFRGDCRKPESMAAYGDRIGPLNLEEPLKASGKVSLRRAVTDSTTLIGFYHSADSMTLNPSQSSAIPKSFLGAAIEGPSSEGFFFYPMCRSNGDAITKATGNERPRIAPNGAPHEWSLEYSPDDTGKVTVTMDGRSTTIVLDPKLKTQGATFDRFGIVTTWIDANGQHAYFDDLTYTASATKEVVRPLKISSAAQLFIDDYLIDSQTSLKRTLHQPKKDNGGNVPVLALDKEFGDQPASLQGNGTIVFDTRLKKYVMLSIGYSPSFVGPSSEKVRIFRFTSADGMQWIKGDDGTPQHIRFDLTDAASGVSAKNTDLFSYYYDTKDAAYPYKGWLFFSKWEGTRDGTYYVRSRDGISWERGRQLTQFVSYEIQHDGRAFRGPGDVTTFYHDPVTDRFIGSLRFFTLDGAGPKKKNLLRAKAFLSLDRIDEPLDMRRVKKLDLVPAGIADNGDFPDDEYYAATNWRYESLWLGGLKVWHGGGDYPYSAAGSAFLKLIVSRDGLNWKKVPFANEEGHPEVFIPNGPEGGNGAQNDGGYVTELTNAPLRIGDELIYYYGCSSYGKNHPGKIRLSGGGIFRARLRPDGFVSVDAGTLTTKPLQFEGENLFVNSVGPVMVELLDRGGKSLGSAIVSGDALRQKVAFGDKSLRELCPSGEARLRFTVKSDGHLYSFAVR